MPELKDLKIKVYYYNPLRGIIDDIEKITKLTKTMIITEHGKWNRNTGQEVGNHPFRTTHIQILTPEIQLLKEIEIMQRLVDGALPKIEVNEQNMNAVKNIIDTWLRIYKNQREG